MDIRVKIDRKTGPRGLTDCRPGRLVCRAHDELEKHQAQMRSSRPKQLSMPTPRNRSGIHRRSPARRYGPDRAQSWPSRWIPAKRSAKPNATVSMRVPRTVRAPSINVWSSARNNGKRHRRCGRGEAILSPATKDRASRNRPECTYPLLHQGLRREPARAARFSCSRTDHAVYAELFPRWNPPRFTTKTLSRIKAVGPAIPGSPREDRRHLL